MSPVQYWFILRHAKVFMHGGVARCDTWLNGRLKRWLKVVAKKLQLMSWKESGWGSLEGKTCELELWNFYANGTIVFFSQNIQMIVKICTKMIKW